MTSALLIGAGLAALVITGVDVLWTVLAAGSGAGPLTARLSRLAWRVALWLGRREEGPRHAFLAVYGVAIVVAMLVAWVVIAFVAWTTIFCATDGAVLSTESGQPAGLLERAWFVGFSLFTLGSTSYTAGDGLWQLGAVAAGGNGIVLVTLAIAYLVPVASAVAERRQLAQYVLSLGATSEEILVRAWSGKDFGSLPQHFIALTAMVHLAGQRHLTYPALDYFHSAREHDASSLSVVALDDAVSLLRHGVAHDVRPDPAALEPLAQAVEAFLGTVGPAFISKNAEPLPHPDLEVLRRAGIPTVENAQFAAALDKETERRQLLARLLADDGWTTDAWTGRKRRQLSGPGLR